MDIARAQGFEKPYAACIHFGFLRLDLTDKNYKLGRDYGQSANTMPLIFAASRAQLY